MFLNTFTVRKERASVCAARSGFTLIEMLTVVAIIGLLISILAPALSKARQQARNVATRGALQSIGAGLEMFRNENQRDFRSTDGLPKSAAAEDAATAGSQYIFGAQWLVRYLMGKDLQGYAPRRNAPRDLLDPNNPEEEEVQWYEHNDDGTPKVERVGPYLSSDAVKLARPDELPGADEVVLEFDVTAETLKQPVILDAFGFPVLYYVANPRQAAKPRAYIACYEADNPGYAPGIFSFADNGLFTGQCEGDGGSGGTCKYASWDFGGTGEHYIHFFGEVTTPDTTYSDYLSWFLDNPDPHTFKYYILNKSLFDSTYDVNNPNAVTVTPYRRDSYMLITAGRDGVYGSDDDVTNFE